MIILGRCTVTLGGYSSTAVEREARAGWVGWLNPLQSGFALVYPGRGIVKKPSGRRMEVTKRVEAEAF